MPEPPSPSEEAAWLRLVADLIDQGDYNGAYEELSIGIRGLRTMLLKQMRRRRV